MNGNDRSAIFTLKQSEYSTYMYISLWSYHVSQDEYMSILINLSLTRQFQYFVHVKKVDYTHKLLLLYVFQIVYLESNATMLIIFVLICYIQDEYLLSIGTNAFVPMLA